jgi:hypothetical protein
MWQDDTAPRGPSRPASAHPKPRTLRVSDTIAMSSSGVPIIIEPIVAQPSSAGITIYLPTLFKTRPSNECVQPSALARTSYALYRRSMELIG